MSLLRALRQRQDLLSAHIEPLTILQRQGLLFQFPESVLPLLSLSPSISLQKKEKGVTIKDEENSSIIMILYPLPI